MVKQNERVWRNLCPSYCPLSHLPSGWCDGQTAEHWHSKSNTRSLKRQKAIRMVLGGVLAIGVLEAKCLMDSKRQNKSIESHLIWHLLWHSALLSHRARDSCKIFAEDIRCEMSLNSWWCFGTSGICDFNSLFCILGEKSALIPSNEYILVLRLEIFLFSYINQALSLFLIRRQINSFNLSLIGSYGKCHLTCMKWSAKFSKRKGLLFVLWSLVLIQSEILLHEQKLQCITWLEFNCI